MSAPEISLLFPLYRSARFLDTLVANVEAVRMAEVEFLFSDRHSFDDTIEKLQQRYGHDPRFRFFKATDALDWVGNINFLIGKSRGRFYRFMPHDDLFPVCGLQAMRQVFDRHPDVAVVYGPIRSFDLNDPNRALQEQVNRNIIPNDEPWTLQTALELNFRMSCPWCFRGLVHLEKLRAVNMRIKSTWKQIGADRCYHFGIALLGRSYYMPEGYSEKAFWAESTSANWNRRYQTGRVRWNWYLTMRAYLRETLTDPAQVAYGEAWLRRNTLALIWKLKGGMVRKTLRKVKLKLDRVMG